MKKQPVQSIANPAYPTLAQVKRQSFAGPVSKVAAVTALTAAMALSSACGEKEGKVKEAKLNLDEVAQKIQDGLGNGGPFVISGDVVIETDPTDGYDLMGEETVSPETTELWLDGEMDPCAETDPESV
ncbi:MAG: hypothetical protein IK020_09150 [Clostridiales bacterium]|nr:hypothetical protein [Clostridiales bacterium]